MKSLRSILLETERRKTALAHFNASDLVALRAVTDAASSLNLAGRLRHRSI